MWDELVKALRGAQQDQTAGLMPVTLMPVFVTQGAPTPTNSNDELLRRLDCKIGEQQRVLQAAESSAARCMDEVMAAKREIQAAPHNTAAAKRRGEDALAENKRHIQIAAKARQQIFALQQRADDLKQVCADKEIHDLLHESTTRTQIGLSELDPDKVLEGAAETRLIRGAGRTTTTTLYTPYANDMRQAHDELASEFDALDIDTVEPARVVAQPQPRTNAEARSVSNYY
jgi:hypothetical protein